MGIYKKINHGFLGLQSKITNKVWVAFIVWVILAVIANLLAYLKVGGEITPAILQLVGIVLFVESLWNWFKRRNNKNKSAINKQEEIIKNFASTSSNKQKGSNVLIRLGIGIFIILIAISTIYYIAYFRPGNSEVPAQQYDAPIKRPNYQITPNDTDSATTRKEQQLEGCLAATSEWYNDMIANYCADYEIKENCNLPEDTVYKWLAIQREYRNECLVRYK